MKHMIPMMLILAITFTVGCTTVPKTETKRKILEMEVQEAIEIFKQTDPELNHYFKNSYGYAVLPKIFKGGFWVGGAHGKGLVYKKGRMTGYCAMSQATLGFSFGGEYFREIIFFKDKVDFEKFLEEEYTFSAQVSAVALESGAAAKADYKDGMLVIVQTDKGLMIDASIGGQKFRYTPKNLVD